MKKSEEFTKDTVKVDHSTAENTDTFTTDTVKPRYNIQNLKPYNPKYNNHLTTEEAQKRGRNGGIKSGEVRRNRKTMREALIDMLSMPLSPEKLEEMGVDTSTLDGNYTMQSAVLSAMLREAVNGSEKAMQLIRDTIGEMPVNRQEITQEIITETDKALMDDLKKTLIS